MAVEFSVAVRCARTINTGTSAPDKPPRVTENMNVESLATGAHSKSVGKVGGVFVDQFPHFQGKFPEKNRLRLIYTFLSPPEDSSWFTKWHCESSFSS